MEQNFLNIHKALLLVPPTGKYIREERCQTPIEELHTVALRPPIGLLYIAAILQQDNVKVKIRDFPAEESTWEDLKTELNTFQPDFLLLSITSPSFPQDIQAVKIAKDILGKKVITAAIGAHFLVYGKETLETYPELDLVFSGEYELAFQQISQKLPKEEINGIIYRKENQIVKGKPPAFIDHLDRIPFPDRNLINNDLYIRPDTGKPQTTIVVSRGCPNQCIFCLSGLVSGLKPRFRSPQNIVEELSECVEKYGITNFLFRADLFTAKKTWVLELCQAIKEQNLNIQWACNSRVDTFDKELAQAMYEAGCWIVSFGIESGSEELLQKMHKRINKKQIKTALRNCREAGIKSSIYFLLGLPWENHKTFNQTVEYACKLAPDFVEFFYVYPFPGTALYNEFVNYDLLPPDTIPQQAYSQPAAPTLYLDLKELSCLRPQALKKFYMRPAYILRTLLRCKDGITFLNYLRYGWRQFCSLYFKKKNPKGFFD